VLDARLYLYERAFGPIHRVLHRLH
jgi:hypothetical protein